MSYQLCEHIRHVAAGPKMRVEISADTRFRANWAQIWSNFEIFVKCKYGQEMASYAWKIIEKTQKGPRVSIYTLQAHFSVLGQNPKIHCFSLLNLPYNAQPTFWDVPSGCNHTEIFVRAEKYFNIAS